MKIKRISVCFILLITFLVSCNHNNAIEVSVVQIPEEYSGSNLIVWFDALHKRIPVQDESGLWGFIDHKANIIIEPKYEMYNPFDQENGIAVKENGKWGMIDFNGEIIVPLDNSRVPMENEGVLRLFNDKTQKYYFADINLVKINDMEYDLAYLYSEGYAATQQKDKWGYTDKNGDITIPFQYEDAKSFVNERASVQINDKWGCIDYYDNMLVEAIYQEALQYNDEGLAIAKTDTETFLVDLFGNKVFEFEREYDYLSLDKSESIVYFLVDYDAGFINIETGKIINQGLKDVFSEGKYVAYDDDMNYYYIDKDGKRLSENLYLEASNYQNGNAVVVDQQRKCHIIDENERILFTVNESVDSISSFTDGVFTLMTPERLYYVVSIE